MNKYTSKYIASHCIDFYFRYGNIPVHILTFGNNVPEELNNIVRNRQLQQMVARKHNFKFEESPNDGNFRINGEYTREIYKQFTDYIQSNPNSGVQEPKTHDILRMFAPNASIGFYSYDFHKLIDAQCEYILVASPSEDSTVDAELLDNLPNLENCEFTKDMQFIRL